MNEGTRCTTKTSGGRAVRRGTRMLMMVTFFRCGERTADVVVTTRRLENSSSGWWWWRRRGSRSRSNVEVATEWRSRRTTHVSARGSRLLLLKLQRGRGGAVGSSGGNGRGGGLSCTRGRRRPGRRRNKRMVLMVGLWCASLCACRPHQRATVRIRRCVRSGTMMMLLLWQPRSGPAAHQPSCVLDGTLLLRRRCGTDVATCSFNVVFRCPVQVAARGPTTRGGGWDGIRTKRSSSKRRRCTLSIPTFPRGTMIVLRLCRRMRLRHAKRCSAR